MSHTNQKTVQYAFALLEERKSSFVNTLVSLYQHRAELSWMREAPLASANVVFLGESSAGEYANLGLRANQIIIFFGETLPQVKSVQIYHIGASEVGERILKVIEQCEAFIMQRMKQKESLATLEVNQQNDLEHEPVKTGALVNPKIKLLRWPSISFIQQNSTYAVLSTLLINHELRFDDFVRKSGVSSKICKQFVEKGRDQGYILLSHAPDAISEASPPERVVAKTGLLARIRSRLGLEVRGR